MTAAEIDACVEELIRVLAALHDVDYDSVGLSNLGRPENYLERQVGLWARQWSHVKTREFSDLDRLHARLARSVPRPSTHSIVRRLPHRQRHARQAGCRP